MAMAFNVKVADNGRLVLPKKVREALAMAGSGTVVFSIDGNEIKLSSIQQSVKRAQDLYRRHATNDRSVDAFLKERKAEAVRDEKA